MSEPTLDFDLPIARRKLAEAQNERDQQQAIVDAMRWHADEYDRSVNRMNIYINQLHALIARKEAAESLRPPPPVAPEGENETTPPSPESEQ
jgi:hypothetical protein